MKVWHFVSLTGITSDVGSNYDINPWIGLRLGAGGVKEFSYHASGAERTVPSHRAGERE